MELTENAFDKTFDNVVKVLPIPDLAEAGIIAIKNILTNETLKEKIKSVFDGILNKDGTIFEKLDDIKSVIKQDDIKDGISKTIDIIVNNARKDKKIDTDMATLLKDSKDLIIDKVLDNEIENRYVGQEKILEKIDKQYTKWEGYFNEMNLDKMNKTYESIKKQFKKLIPTVDIIDKVKEIDNLTLLAKNKIEKGENILTDLEKDLCRKAG